MLKALARNTNRQLERGKQKLINGCKMIEKRQAEYQQKQRHRSGSLGGGEECQRWGRGDLLQRTSKLRCMPRAMWPWRG